MNLEVFNLFMDLAIMAALAVTIFYAVRLSRNLNNFRAQRDAFMNLIADLSAQIEEAQTAVNRLNNVSQKTGQDLQKSVNEARGILTELEVVNQSASSMAQRLEKLKDGGRSQSFAKPVDFAAQAPLENIERSSFFIQDRDFGAGVEEEFEDDAEDAAFASKAEKDLWRALRKNKKFTGPGLA